MTNKLNQNDWLVEFDIPPMGGQPDMGAGGPPMGQPGAPGDPMGTGDQVAEPTDMRVDQSPEDISNDPQYPDMPEEKDEDDFETWKIKYIDESIKGDYHKLISMIQEVRDRDLDEIDARFCADNLNVNFLRQNSSVFNASTEIRKLIKKDLDRTNPATSVVGHISSVLDQGPLLNEIYIKTSGLGGGTGQDQHRKFIAALLGGVMVGSGGSNEDIVFQEQDYSIRISTRFLSKWGNVNLGRWFLKEDDPERYLKEAEMDRLESGSPEERDVLRRRVVIESIAEQFRERAFIINVVGSDGTVQHLGWDLGTSLKSAYLDGKLVVRSKNSDAKEAFVDEEGSIIPIPNMSIFYVKEQEELDGHGKPRIEELEFISHKDGVLYLTAQLSLIKEASMSLQGMIIQETPYSGNPTDLLRIKRCVPSSPEIILRNC